MLNALTCIGAIAVASLISAPACALFVVCSSMSPPVLAAIAGAGLMVALIGA